MAHFYGVGQKGHLGFSVTSFETFGQASIIYLMVLSDPSISIIPIQFPLICFCCSVVKLCLTVCIPVDCSMPGSAAFTNSWSLLRFVSIELVILPNHLILYHSLLLLPSVFPSIRVFPMNQLFALGSPSIGDSPSTSVLQ